MSSLEYLTLSLYPGFRFIAQYFIIFVVYIFVYYIYLYYIYFFIIRFYFQKQSSVGFLKGECSASMPQVCVVASVPKYDFNKVVMQLCWGSHFGVHVLSVNLLCIFRAPLCRSIYEGMLLSFAKALLSLIVYFKAHLHTATTVLPMTHKFLIFTTFIDYL